jgi:hypothetical protein
MSVGTRSFGTRSFGTASAASARSEPGPSVTAVSLIGTERQTPASDPGLRKIIGQLTQMPVPSRANGPAL